ncbi:fasciclin-1-like, partial [Penaeus monodon]|uniref:fasciclin-1-like n=1 Tax=Penaeus monodon TaxID=6687 RepID=UPI0018A7B421
EFDKRVRELGVEDVFAMKGKNTFFIPVDSALNYLHIIDQVIEPTVTRAQPNASSAAAATFLNPDAQRLLLKPRLYGIVDRYAVSEFDKRVRELGVEDVFAMKGKNTFFIPVDSALNPNGTHKDMIDKQVVHGHVVPNRVLFTRTVTSSSNQYESLAFTDNLKVFITMENVTVAEGGEMAYYVKSNTIASDVSHKKGTVLARIIKGNVPVRNGVVHFIDRSLMVVTSSIMLYLQEKDGQLSKFYQLMKEHYPELTYKLVSQDEHTLFAPSNEAFNMVNTKRLNEVILNSERLARLLKLHVINRRLTTDEIVDHSTRETVYEKLGSDPMLRPSMRETGSGPLPQLPFFPRVKREGKRPAERDENFTLFVPRKNPAWISLKKNLRRLTKLFMGEFSYHVRYILERHMIVGEAFSLEQLAALTTNSTIRGGFQHERLQMTRGKIYFQAKVKQSYGDVGNLTEMEAELPMPEYYVEWNGIRAKVVRPDVECVNGIVHVIDGVLMVNRDVTVAGSSARPSTCGILVLVLALGLVLLGRE